MFSSLNCFKRSSSHSTTLGWTKRRMSSKSWMMNLSLLGLLSFKLTMNSFVGTSLQKSFRIQKRVAATSMPPKYTPEHLSPQAHS